MSGEIKTIDPTIFEFDSLLLFNSTNDQKKTEAKSHSTEMIKLILIPSPFFQLSPDGSGRVKRET
jgi:hypothetical protein